MIRIFNAYQVPAIYLLFIDSEEFKSFVFNTILTVIEVGLLITGVGAIASGTLKGARLVLAIADIVISAADMFIRAFEDEIYDMKGGPEFLKYWNYTQMMIGLYGITRVIKNAPETISDLSQSWRKVKENPDNKTKLKNIDGDDLKNFEKSIDDFDDALKDVKKSELENLDEVLDIGNNKNGNFVGSSLDNVVTNGGDLLNIFKNRLSTRVQNTSGLFSLAHTDAEIIQIINKGKSLNIADNVIDDMLFISCRNAKPINASELMNQMDNWINVADFDNFLVNRFSNKITKNGNAIELTNKTNQQLIDIANDYNLNPSLYNNQAKSFSKSMLDRKVSAYSNDKVIPGFKELYNSVKGNYPNLNIENITIQTSGGSFDLKPFIKL